MQPKQLAPLALIVILAGGGWWWYRTQPAAPGAL
ncbi:MAG: hypothetical protein RL635_470, partial [Chloroflexota bacterium]